MSSDVSLSAATAMTRKCEFCAEEMAADAKKCKQCGEFVRPAISLSVAVIFMGGVIIACLFAGMQPGQSQGVIAVGVWAIFALLFVGTFAKAFPHRRS